MPRPGRRSRSAAGPSSANGGSSPALSPTAWKRLENACSPSLACRRANGAVYAPQMQSNVCTKNLSDGSRPKLFCHPPTPPRCCSGRCSLQDRSTCARWMVGSRSPQNPLISRLTLPPETIPSCYRRLRHTKFQPHSGRHLTTSRRSVFRGCRYSLMFRPPSLLFPQIVPTAAILLQGSRGFYVRAYRALLPPHAPDMLTVRIQVIDGTGTFTLSDSQPCRLLTSLHRHYPASAVLWTHPTPHLARSGPHGPPVGLSPETSRWG